MSNLEEDFQLPISHCRFVFEIPEIKN